MSKTRHNQRRKLRLKAQQALASIPRPAPETVYEQMGGSPERAREMARIGAIEHDWLVRHYGPLRPGEDYSDEVYDAMNAALEAQGVYPPGFRTW